MADEGDFSSAFEIEHNAEIISAHINRQKLEPEFDLTGRKICIECGDIIPLQRAAIKETVRCILCQQQVEKEEKLYAL